MVLITVTTKYPKGDSQVVLITVTTKYPKGDRQVVKKALESQVVYSQG